MKKEIKTNEVRSNFINYFKKNGHAIITSSPVVPHEDPTLLFNNAGMNQFKDVFLGQSKRDYARATSSQKCIRVGGKHNDLENVGHTSRHLTFFEMLGNFSFGDYFKEEAIKFAWEVSTKIFGFEEEKLWPSIFKNDDESFEIWKKYVPENKIVRFGEKENFWAMGDVGPCGPCSEILYDRGPKYGPATNPHEDIKEERFLEFWNLVFMQYNRKENGKLINLKEKSIDTGAGIERIVALMMDVDNVFETDILRTLIAQIEQISNVKYDIKDHKKASAFHVIADHIRTLTFAIADGAQPSNVDRGYVLRKILRRAMRYGRTIGLEKPFLAKLLPCLIGEMGNEFREIKIAKGRIEEILTLEEEGFIKTLNRGGNLLNQIINNAKNHQISGDDAFKLKDTYGFPLEEIKLIAIDNDLKIDINRYQELEKKAKELSKSAHKTTSQKISENIFSEYLKNNKPSIFTGHVETSNEESTITAIVIDGKLANEIKENEEGIIILDKTPFYAEKGGQIGDHGVISNDNTIFEVNDCQTPYNGIIAHIGKLTKGHFKTGKTVTAQTDKSRRQNIANNHTATHLLHWALQCILGEHVRQAGSIVDDKRLRFDFNHHKAMTKEEIKEVENLVNKQIRKNSAVDAYELDYSEVQKNNDIKQFFGDKYESKVRIVDIGDAKELCGGTHTNFTGTIGYFRIVKEGSIAAGIRRIEALTGQEAEHFAMQTEEHLYEYSNMLKVTPDKIPSKIKQMIEENKELTKELKKIKNSMLQDQIKEIIKSAENINGISFIAKEVDIDTKELRNLVCQVNKDNSVILLSTTSKDKCNVIIKVSKNLDISAKKLIEEIATIINGSGGGSQEIAQGAGSQPNKIPDAIDKIKSIL